MKPLLTFLIKGGQFRYQINKVECIFGRPSIQKQHTVQAKVLTIKSFAIANKIIESFAIANKIIEQHGDHDNN